MRFAGCCRFAGEPEFGRNTLRPYTGPRCHTLDVAQAARCGGFERLMSSLTRRQRV